MNLQEVVFDHLHAVAYQGNFSYFLEKFVKMCYLKEKVKDQAHFDEIFTS